MSSAPLDVYVSGRLVGTLVDEAGRYVFTYLPDVPPEDLASLLMPVRSASYDWNTLHPLDIKSDAKPGKTAPAPLREQLGMSNPDPAAPRTRANPYANADGPFSHKSR